MSKKDTIFFYHDKPVFGLDVGSTSIKAMQIQHSKKGTSGTVLGYGVASFDTAAIKDGVIVDPETIAKSAHELFSKNLVGEITTRRVSIAIPASRTYTRSVNLPYMKRQDVADAVRLEAEQYIPMALESLYLDYNIIAQSEEHGTEILAVAAPKKIVDSYIKLADLLGLEVVAMETTIGASSRLFVHAEQNDDIPTVLIDLGAQSSDITIYDNTLIVTGTVPGGGDNFNELISQKLGVTKQEAHIIKTKYGLGLSKKQKEITEGLSPILDQLVKEIRRMIRYYEERHTTDKQIKQVVTMGGGANMPGLSEFLTNQLRLPVRMCDPWQHLDFEGLQPPNSIEKSMYVTVAGLALIDPKEAFKV